MSEGFFDAGHEVREFEGFGIGDYARQRDGSRGDFVDDVAVDVRVCEDLKEAGTDYGGGCVGAGEAGEGVHVSWSDRNGGGWGGPR